MNSVVAKTLTPGRPKDLEKRAAILEAGKRLFPQNGFEGTSMDAIAAEAGVSKLTVYSHFTDKETLFKEVIRAKCEEQLPSALFLADLKGPLRGQLRSIAQAFFQLVTADESIAMHRMMTSNTQPASRKLAEMFWEAGPQRVMAGFEAFLRDEVAAGQLDIPEVHTAASQFFCLLKGELHARMMCGCCQPITAGDIEQHLDATVEMFLRAYLPR